MQKTNKAYVFENRSDRNRSERRRKSRAHAWNIPWNIMQDYYYIFHILKPREATENGLKSARQGARGTCSL
jgi:hypothetical protein